jgi:hypothetical protein
MRIVLLANTPNGNVNPHLQIITISIRLNIKGGFERETSAHIKGKPFRPRYRYNRKEYPYQAEAPED